MTRLLLISKNEFLLEFFSNSKYQITWYNDELLVLHDTDEFDVIIFDGFSYGIKNLEFLPQLPIIILDDYCEAFLISKMMNRNAVAYLCVYDFINELDEAIQAVLAGGQFLTKSLSGQTTEHYLTDGN